MHTNSKFKYCSKKMKLFKVNYLTANKALKIKVEKFISEWLDNTNSIVTSTSGSTGVPKEIVLDKSKMKASAKATGLFFDFKAGEKILLCLSPDSIGGKMLIVRAIIYDMELVVVELSRNPLSFIDFKIDFVAMVPMQIQTILKENQGKLNLIKNLMIGGATVSDSLKQDLKSFDCNAFESFGMTETMSHIAIKRLNTSDVFEALDGIHFSTSDNQLTIHAPSLGLEKLITTDVVELIDKHTFKWKGRADFAINSGGIKFHPEAIEKKLSQFISPRFFITGQQDQLLGEKIILIVEGNEALLDLSKLKNGMQQVLNNYEIPKNIYFREKFEETSSGKINRLATRKAMNL